MPVRILKSFSRSCLWFAYAAASLWAILALQFDMPNVLGPVLAAVFVLVVIAAVLRICPKWKALAIWTACLALVIGWWLTLAPSNNANWQPDVARLPWSELNGDHVTIHNVRNCDYRTELHYTPRWEDRSIDISQIQGVDLFIVHWGSPWIAHAILSFELPADQYVAISVEARKRVGQDYSALRGFFRQYTLIYVVGEERDLVRLRTNFRKGEDVRLYRTRTTARDSQQLFLAYMHWINSLRNRPEWYNALTTNCTSGIVKYLREEKIGGLPGFDWRTLLNGRGDEMLYQIGDLVTDGLSFSELQKRALINPTAVQADDSPDFSKLIRVGRPGFTPASTP